MAQCKSIELRINTERQYSLSLGTERQHSLSLGNAIPVPVKDYNLLDNKPEINGRTLVGNKTVAWLLQDGLIINGGNATGYEPPVIPTGIPQAEGVVF